MSDPRVEDFIEPVDDVATFADSHLSFPRGAALHDRGLLGWADWTDSDMPEFGGHGNADSNREPDEQFIFQRHPHGSVRARLPNADDGGQVGFEEHEEAASMGPRPNPKPTSASARRNNYDDIVAIAMVADLSKVDRRGKFDVCEVFSPSRMAAAAPRHRLRGGWSLDVRFKDERTSRVWDLTDEKDKLDALEMIKRDKTYFVMACPPCTKFCLLQYLNDYRMSPEEWHRAVGMVEFAVTVCETQMRAGRHFAFEHPLTATSWKLDCLVRLKDAPGVEEAVLDMRLRPHVCRR